MKAFVSPKKIYYGEGSINILETILKERNAQNIFLLTDPILRELNVIEPILEIINRLELKVEISTDVVPEPSLLVGNRIIEKVRDQNPDLVIGVGGGSAIDLAKAAAVLGENEGKVEDYLNLTGTNTLQSKGLPKVLIPTTAGTGAEVTDIAVFSLKDTKDVITHEYLLADYAIVDPVLTYTLPEKVTASSGVDAFTHAIEAYTSVNASALTNTLAAEAMDRIASNIRTAVWNGRDKKARGEMALGSLMAGMSFYNAGVAGVHGLAYPLGGLFKLPHGESNAVLLPYVYDYIWPSCIDKMIDIAKILRLPLGGKSEGDIAISVVRNLQKLVKDVGLPTTIKEYNITKDDIEMLTENGLKQTRLLNRSPKKLTKEDIRAIYQNAYDGKFKSIE